MDDRQTGSRSISRESSVTVDFEYPPSRHQRWTPPPQSGSEGSPITLDDGCIVLEDGPATLDSDPIILHSDSDVDGILDITEVAGPDIHVLASQPPQPVLHHHQKESVPEVCMDGIIYKSGQSLELHDSSYLRVDSIVTDSMGNVFFRGRRLRKLRHLVMMDKPKGYLPVWRNELLWDVTDKEDIPLALVKRFVGILFTNSVKSEQSQWEYDPERKLFCRLKEIATPSQISIQYMSRDEADDLPGCQSESWELRQQWRGATRLFGAADKDAANTQGMSVIDLEQDHSFVDLTEPEPDDRLILRLNNSREYTFGDAFCGAGGVSSGARKAGLHITWGFDKSSHAMRTYRLNFKSAICEVSDIFDFLTNDPEFMKVDVCHGSPPCQTFSPAKTVECETDDANFACIFSCADLMKRAKPRVLTMEETSGLYERHRDVFDRVIQGFLEIGYSVSWRVLNCEEYGVPQCRRRLIIIAAGPGETLPSFPKPTHGPPGSGLQPQATINSIIGGIPRGAADHDVKAALERGLRGGHREPFDANQQAMTITTGGGQFNYHPSGKRCFTNREFAALQTFDNDYRFGQREIRKQIGNAVPPVLGKALYRETIKSLKRSDSAEAAEMKSRGVSEL